MFSPALFATFFTNVGYAPIQDQRDPLVDRQYAVVRTLNNEPPVEDKIRFQGFPDHRAALGFQLQSSAVATQDPKVAVELPSLLSPAKQLVQGIADVAAPFESIAPAFALDQARFTSNYGMQKLAGMDKKVSANFNEATVGDVLKWISKQGVSYVVNHDELKSRKISMNLNGVKLHEALNALAESIGANWQVKGSMLILRNGFSGFGFSSSAPAFTMPPAVKDDVVRGLQNRTQAESLRKLSEDQRKLAETYRLDASKMRENVMRNADRIRSEHHTRMTEMIKTLTPTQRELHKKQGHLKWNDLTPAQRKAIGVEKEPNGDSNFSMVVRMNDETWTFKGK
jgi:hypothetical protein